MVGMASDNAGSPPQLLGEHGAGEHVRPGHRAKGDEQISFPARRITVAIGGTDQETRLTHAIVTPAAEDRGEFLGAQLAAAFIKHNIARRGQRRWNRTADIGQFGGFQRPGDALGIAINQLCLRRTGNLAARDDVELHAAPEGPSPKAHIRSRL